MASSLPPGIGNAQQAQQATAFIRDQPWYQQWLTSNGLVNPPSGVNGGNPVDAKTGQPAQLTDAQQQSLLSTARNQGIGISNSYTIDQNGQIAQPPSHVLRNVLIGAGIGGLALTGLGAAGIGPLGGLFGSGAAAGGAAGTGLAADGTLASTAIGDGYIPAIAGGVGTDVSGLAAGTAGAAGAAGAGGVGTAIGAGQKVAGLLGAAGSVNNAFGNADAQQAQALTNNRFLAAKTDQGGPAADKLALQNAMRANIIAGAGQPAVAGPGNNLSLGGNPLPNLTTASGTAYAQQLATNLAARQAAGLTPTEFGVPPPSAAETAATNAASNSTKIGGAINAGSQLANLYKLFSG